MKTRKKRKLPVGRKPSKSSPDNVMTYLVDVYRLAKSGMSDMKIADAVGVNYNTFKKWKETYPAVQKALEQGRGPIAEETETFKDYVHDRLPPHLQDVWKEIEECEKGNCPVTRVEALLTNAGTRGRQHLFLYALINSNFHASEACRKVNIKKSVFDRWVTQDPDFAELVDEIHWHKANFFEAALIGLVKKGDAKAILHANKTFNANRGYGTPGKTKNVINLPGGKVQVVSLADLNLPLEERKRILEQVRQQTKALPEHKEE